MNEATTKALVDECQRQSENCAYTATTFMIWLRVLKGIRITALVAPVIFGALATWKLFAGSPVIAAVFTLLTTVIPPAYNASKADEAIESYTALGGEFINLRDRFRQSALIASQKPAGEFETEIVALMKRMEDARQRMHTPPEWCFKLARKKHKAGHYHHDYDQRESA